MPDSTVLTLRLPAVFNEYSIQQAPASTFKVPIVSGEIAILAVSELTPTYYDFCIADKDCNVCCWLARDTFPGVTHSGDLIHQGDLLDYIKIDAGRLTERELAVFISGYQTTRLTRYATSPGISFPYSGTFESFDVLLNWSYDTLKKNSNSKHLRDQVDTDFAILQIPRKQPCRAYCQQRRKGIPRSPFSSYIILTTGYRFFISSQFLWMLLQLEMLQSAVHW
jgi:hypothetical protein